MEPQPKEDISAQLQNLPATLRATYTEVNNEARDRHEQMLTRLREQHAPETFMSLYNIVNSPNLYEDNLIEAAGIQLKSVCYDLTITMLPDCTDQYLDMLYKLATKNEGLSRSQREYVGTAVEYFLNRDERTQQRDLVNLYRENVLNQLLKDLEVTVLPGSVHGLLEIYKAYFDGMVEIQDMDTAFKRTFPTLKRVAERYLTILRSQRQNPILLSNNQSLRSQPTYKQLESVFQVVARFFDIIDIVLGRLMDEYEDVIVTITNLRADMQFRKLLNDYLLYPFDESCSKGILSSQGLLKDSINQFKEFIVKIIVVGYDDMPFQMLLLCIQTYIIENGKHHNQSKAAEEIMMAVLDILESQLKRTMFYELFSKLSMEMIIKGMSYLKHNEDDQDMMLNDPEQYLDTFNDSCLCFNKRFVRTKACSLITALAGHVDGMLNFVISFINILLVCTLQPEVPPEIRPLMQPCELLSQSLLQYEIANEGIAVKLDVGLYLTCLIQPMASRNPTHFVSVHRFLHTVMSSQEVNSHPHLVIKCMYAIGGYRMVTGASWVLQHMKESELFRIQGINTFSQLIRGKLESPELLSNLLECLVSVVDLIQPTSALFETLVLNNYNELLGHSNGLHHKCVRKVVQHLVGTMQYSDPNPKQHKDQIAIFNMFQGIIQKEEDMMKLLELEREFAIVALMKAPNCELVDHILCVMSTILLRTGKLTEYQRRFVAANFQAGCRVTEDLLLYLNRVVSFESNTLNLTSIVDLLCSIMEQLCELGEEKLIGQAALVLGHSIIRIKDTTPAVIAAVRKLIPRMRFDITKLRLQGLLGISLEISMEHTLHLLTETPGWSPGQSLYEEALLNFPLGSVCLQSKLALDRKIYVAGQCKTIECEILKGRHPKNQVLAIARLMKTFAQESKIKLNSQSAATGKRKRGDPSKKQGGTRADMEQEHMNEDVGRDVSVHRSMVLELQTSHLLKFQHPLSELNDLEYFQQRLIGMKDWLLQAFSPEQLRMLGDLMSLYEDKHGRTRKIVRVSSQ